MWQGGPEQHLGVLQVHAVPADQELEQDLARREQVEGRERQQEVLQAQAPAQPLHGVVLVVVIWVKFDSSRRKNMWKINLSFTIFKDDVSEPLEGGALRDEGVEVLFGGELEVLEEE